VVVREFRGREEVKKKTLTGREDVHPQNRLNGLILNWCIGGCWFTPTLMATFPTCEFSMKLTCLLLARATGASFMKKFH
jgi:hypothetical protein